MAASMIKCLRSHSPLNLMWNTVKISHLDLVRTNFLPNAG